MARTSEWVVLVLALTACGCQSSEPSAGTSPFDIVPVSASPLEGAWRLVEIQYVASDGGITDGTPQESLFLFSDDHYSVGYSHHEAPSPPFAAPWSPTESEKRDRFSSLVVNAGTYELTGSSLILRPEFAVYPAVINSEAKVEYVVSGDTLTLTYIDHVAADGVADPYYVAGERYLLRLTRVR